MTSERLPHSLVAARNLTWKQARRAQGRLRHTWKALVEGLKDTMHAVGRVQESTRNVSVNAGKDAFRAIRRPVRELRRRRSELREQRGWNEIEWAAEREIGEIAAGDHPIVVGPWLSEVGYEVLYWVPFLRWVKQAFKVDPARVTVLTRGGAGAWYGGIAGRRVEIWDHIDPAEFARRNAERNDFKQHALADLDRELIAAAVRTEGLSGARVLHPSLMFRLFKLFWSGHRASGFMDMHTRFELQPPPGVIDRRRLPDEYVAVKFYAARSMPDTPEVRRRLKALVEQTAERSPVVLLDTGLDLDDHADYAFAGSSRIISARELLEPRTNLAAQTDIIAYASSYIGTCGSLTWLAPMLGVHTSAVFADAEFLHNHLGVAMRASHKLKGAGAFCPLDLRALDPRPLQ